MDAKDEIYHRRCLELAKNGHANVAPNPMVGAVIVAQGKIIGEGYHAKYGGPHAEVNAINSVKDKTLLAESTLYVNLEPCAHFGKTPPCADLIIEKKIPRVVIGLLDPFPQVAGKGIEKLRNAGVEVEYGLHEDECQFLNRRFLTFHQKHRPYIILKWAETADGFIDIVRNENTTTRPTWITDELTRTLVHKWRSEEQSILVGTNTAFYDNPKLNVRDWNGKQPIRMALDKSLRLPESLHIFDKNQKTVIFTEMGQQSSEKIEYVKADFCNTLDDIVKYCNENKILSIFVEGGAALINSFINSNLWDEARVFKAEVKFKNGLAAPKLNESPQYSSMLTNSLLEYYYNKKK